MLEQVVEEDSDYLVEALVDVRCKASKLMGEERGMLLQPSLVKRGISRTSPLDTSIVLGEGPGIGPAREL